jgi:hypothetical protein
MLVKPPPAADPDFKEMERKLGPLPPTNHMGFIFDTSEVCDDGICMYQAEKFPEFRQLIVLCCMKYHVKSAVEATHPPPPQSTYVEDDHNDQIEFVDFWVVGRDCSECGCQINSSSELLFKLFVKYVGESRMFLFRCIPSSFYWCSDRKLKCYCGISNTNFTGQLTGCVMVNCNDKDQAAGANCMSQQ